ncbi:MAG: hypothetical protein LBO66_09765 [Deltaproteobacteria bacterium]|nr:hypothetical protein [Deltaproteobacteria bacterium]
MQYSGQIVRRAISTGMATHDISADRKGALGPALGLSDCLSGRKNVY